MSVSQNQPKQTAVKVRAVFQLFKSPHFILLGLVLALVVSASAWLYQQQVQQQQKSVVQTQAIIDVTQDAFVVQAVSQDLSKLVLSLHQAMESLDRQQSDFLKSNRFFLINSVYQEAHYAQTMVIKAFETMAHLDKALVTANEHARQYQAQSEAHAAHYAHMQQLQNNADILGRQFYKLSWKFDELTATITKSLQLTRYNGFEAGSGHYASVGAQKNAALDSSIFWVGSKLVDLQTQMDKTMGFVQQAVTTASASPSSSLLGSVAPLFALLASVGLLLMGAIWFYGVIKPQTQLFQQAQALSTGHVSLISQSYGQWGRIAHHLERLAEDKNELQFRNASQAEELERLKLSLLTNSHLGPESVPIDELLVSSKQQPLPGFGSKAHQLN